MLVFFLCGFSVFIYLKYSNSMDLSFFLFSKLRSTDTLTCVRFLRCIPGWFVCTYAFLCAESSIYLCVGVSGGEPCSDKFGKCAWVRWPSPRVHVLLMC